MKKFFSYENGILELAEASGTLVEQQNNKSGDEHDSEACARCEEVCTRDTAGVGGHRETMASPKQLGIHSGRGSKDLGLTVRGSAEERLLSSQIRDGVGGGQS